MIACMNQELNRPWTNAIFKIGVAVSDDQLARSRCQARAAQDMALFPDFGTLGGVGLDCPCSSFQASFDRRFFPFIADDSSICYLPRFVSFLREVDEGVLHIGRRCCYSRLVYQQLVLYNYD